MATKKKELLEQEAPVTETVMSEGETLPADTAQPESLPADTGNSLDLNELLGIFFRLIRSAINCMVKVLPAPLVPRIDILAFL